MKWWENFNNNKNEPLYHNCKEEAWKRKKSKEKFVKIWCDKKKKIGSSKHISSVEMSKQIAE